MLATQSRVRDRNPEIPAVSAFKHRHFNYIEIKAGKCKPRGPGSRECISQPQDRPSTPEDVKRFRGFNRPDVGRPRIFPAASKDPPVAKDLCHGVTSKESLAVSLSFMRHHIVIGAFLQQVKDLVNPPRPTAFQVLKEQQKESIYYSNKMSPLGMQL